MRALLLTCAALAAALAALALPPAAGRARAADAPAPVHALAMHGAPKYGPEVEAFAYVNPDAPKGGTLKMHAVGTFDSLNPFIVKGTPPVGLGMVFDTLLTSSADEAFTEYGLLAETIRMPEDRTWVAFTLRAEARFHDGRPVTPEDVIFSLETLRAEGDPFYGLYYKNVAAVEKTGPREVTFRFDGTVNRELPLIIGQMPVLPAHAWQGKAFADSTLEPPLGSGPYRVKSFEPGRFIVYERVRDWWGAMVPAVRGLYNFDEIRYDYYRDATVAQEAFKAGAYDVRVENSAKNWATAYSFPARSDGRVVLAAFPQHNPSGMQGFAFNLRRSLFQDPRVRQALAHAFDFEWSNQTLFYGQYTRSRSYFDNSELAATGLPSPAELALLEPLRAHLPPEVFTTAYAPPSTQGENGLRANLRTALALLADAGWTVQDGVLRNAQGQPFRFEILLNEPIWERISLPWAQNLKRLGIEASVRTVDDAQYTNRLKSYDFDVVVGLWGQSTSPGNEQREFWGSDAADTPGSRNLTGIRNPAIDALIDLIITAPDREALVVRTRALDRVLQWSHLVVPHWHMAATRVAYWNRFGMPAEVPERGVQILAWWQEAAAARPGGTAPAASLADLVPKP